MYIVSLTIIYTLRFQRYVDLDYPGEVELVASADITFSEHIHADGNLALLPDATSVGKLNNLYL